MAVRQAVTADLDGGAEVLTEAFATDPWFSWLYPEAGQWPDSPRAWFTLVLRRAFDRGHTCVAPDGIASWIPPDVEFPEPTERELVFALLEDQIGARATDALGVIGGAGAVFPHTPRFHCVYVGVRPAAQGRGIGRRLLCRVLDRCDADGIAASLTSTNDTNLPFYRSLGFTEIGAVPIPGTGAALRPMWRDPG
jgi:ribosomal protein S18 acetylase RimI-like enzyme